MMSNRLAILWHRFDLVRFFWSSVAATVVDYALYLLLALAIIPEAANVVSQSTAMVVNFTLHRLVVFRGTHRGWGPSFLISISLSVVGMLLGTFVIYVVRIPFPEWVLVPKLVATGTVFFWNFFSKRTFAFPVRSEQTPDSGLSGRTRA